MWADCCKLFFGFQQKLKEQIKKQCDCILLHWSSVPEFKSADITVRAYEATAFCKMSTGKRLAKRSILGTRVVAPGEDGRLYPGMIQVNKNHSNQGLHPQVLQKTDTGVTEAGLFYRKDICLVATLPFQSHTHFSNWPTWRSANQPTWTFTTPTNMKHGRSCNLPCVCVVYYDVDICAAMNHVFFRSVGYCDYRNISNVYM